jgi:hypothetical protein
MKKLPLLIFTMGFLLLLLACNQTPPAATPLPTAVPPEIMPAGEDGGWVIGLQHEFGPDFWEEGTHEYGFFVQCPLPGFENYGTDWLTFKINDEAPQAEDVTVYLRVGGVTTEAYTPSYLQGVSFHSSLPTTAVIYIAGLPEETAFDAAEECEGIVTWDRTNTAELVPIEPFIP